MASESLFILAVEGSLLLGLIHGVNPCGHSWVVLAPFVLGNRSKSQVIGRTVAFLAGTALACLALGLSLGGLAGLFPQGTKELLERSTDLVIILLGLILIIKPKVLHGDHHHHPPRSYLTSAGLFSLGFINMIIPCPTAAVMYSYAINSADALRSSLIFGTYALGTAVSLSLVIFALYKLGQMVLKLARKELETIFLRLTGLITASFGIYSLLT
ncbi:urease accessory protein UreH domain-containing protein [Thermosulfuriphilus sp.]